MYIINSNCYLISNISALNFPSLFSKKVLHAAWFILDKPREIQLTHLNEEISEMLQ